MIGLALLLAGAAVLIGMPGRRRVPGVAPGPAEATRPASRWWPVVVGVGVVGLAWLFGGSGGAVLGLAATVIAATAARFVVLRRRLARAHRLAADVSGACTVLASELEVGKVPATALTAAAEDCPVLVPAAAAARIGGDIPQIWLDQAEEPGCAGLGVLARAWRVAVNTGAPLAPGLETVAAALRADEEVDRLVAGELAAPRLTGVLLALLPVAGVALGYLIGGDPLGFLTSTPVGWGCLLGGCVLACLGVLWTERLAGNA